MADLFFPRPSVGTGLAIWKRASEENKGSGRGRTTGGCEVPEGAWEGWGQSGKQEALGWPHGPVWRWWEDGAQRARSLSAGPHGVKAQPRVTRVSL